VSLEKNVLFLQRYLNASGMASLPHEILFSDGNGGARDLQYEDPNFEPPRMNELLGEVLNMDRGLATRYRPHSIPHL
jgi:hypothetical protein